jgi:hypothetical protein
MKVTFKQSIEYSATEFYMLRQRAENKDLFDKAVDWCVNQKFICDLKMGSVKSKEGFFSQFVNYDWSKMYDDAPNSIFHDFFKSPLLTRYQRLLRGLE